MADQASLRVQRSGILQAENLSAAENFVHKGAISCVKVRRRGKIRLTDCLSSSASSCPSGNGNLSAGGQSRHPRYTIQSGPSAEFDPMEIPSSPAGNPLRHRHVQDPFFPADGTPASADINIQNIYGILQGEYSHIF